MVPQQKTVLLNAWAEATTYLRDRLEDNDFAAVPPLLAARQVIIEHFAAADDGPLPSDLPQRVLTLEEETTNLLLAKRDALQQALVQVNRREQYRNYEGAAATGIINYYK